MMPADHALQSKQNNLKNEKKIMEKVCVTSAVKNKIEKRKENSSVSNISMKFLRELIM